MIVKYDLPADVARCDGKLIPDCLDCVRRTSRIDHPWQTWFSPTPKDGKCEHRINPVG